MSILSTIVGWFATTPKQETTTQRITTRVAAITAKADAAAKKASDIATAMRRAQLKTELEAKMAERRLRLTEWAAQIEVKKAERHMARLEACDQQAAELNDYEHDDYVAIARANKAAPILAVYQEELEALTSDEVLAGASELVAEATRALRTAAGLV